MGAPASFDSVEAVFDYNLLLLGNLEREAAELCDYKGEPIYEPYHAGYVQTSAKKFFPRLRDSPLQPKASQAIKEQSYSFSLCLGGGVWGFHI